MNSKENTLEAIEYNEMEKLVNVIFWRTLQMGQHHCRVHERLHKRHKREAKGKIYFVLFIVVSGRVDHTGHFAPIKCIPKRKIATLFSPMST